MSRTNNRNCPICGNEVSPFISVCPFCKGSITGNTQAQRKSKSINLEKGMPPVSEALQKLKSEITTSKRQGYKMLTVIHGYGASGKGGEIKEAVRRFIESNSPGLIKSSIPGDHLPLSAGDLSKIPFDIQNTRSYPDFNRYNPGITIVFI